MDSGIYFQCMPVDSNIRCLLCTLVYILDMDRLDIPLYRYIRRLCIEHLVHMEMDYMGHESLVMELWKMIEQVTSWKEKFDII